jgi:hypothetical protein
MVQFHRKWLLKELPLTDATIGYEPSYWERNQDA